MDEKEKKERARRFVEDNPWDYMPIVSEGTENSSEEEESSNG